MIGMESTLPRGFYDAFTHRFTDLDDVRLHHVEGGPTDGETIVLLHGWPQTWYAWRKVLPPLVSAGYRVIAAEYRGAGESSRPAGGYDKLTMAADIRQLMERLHIGRVHLVGRGIGVMVAYALAAQWPERIASLTLIDVPVPGTAAWYKAKTDPMTWHFGLHQQRDVAEMLVAGREYAYLSTFYRARTKVAAAITDSDLAVYARAYAAPGAMRAGFELYRAFDQDERDFAQLLPTKLAIPVLAVGGALDNADLIAEMAREVATDVTDAAVPGGGHWTPEENPEFLVERLLAFLSARR